MKLKNYLLVLGLTLVALKSQAQTCQDYFENKNGPLISVLIGTDRLDARSISVARSVALQLELLGARTVILNGHEAFMTLFQTGHFGRYFDTGVEFQNKYDTPINNSQGLVMVFPEYHGADAGAAKHFLDYLQGSMSGKPVSIVGISEGQIGAYRGTENLKATFDHRGAHSYAQKVVNINNVNQRFDGIEVKDESLKQRMQTHFTGFLEFIKKLNQ